MYVKKEEKLQIMVCSTNILLPNFLSRSVKNYRKIQERTGTESITKVMRSSAKRKNRQMRLQTFLKIWA